MPSGEPKPGFTFPLFPKDFGLSFGDFKITSSDQGIILLGANDKPLSPVAFKGAETGICRLEIFPTDVDPMGASGDKALFIAENINFQFARHQDIPEPFVILISEHPENFQEALGMFVGQRIHLRFTPRVSIKIKQPDPWNEGWTLGWGVYHSEPWDFEGLYDTEEEAKTAADKLDGYKVSFGSHENGTDNFIGYG